MLAGSTGRTSLLPEMQARARTLERTSEESIIQMEKLLHSLSLDSTTNSNSNSVFPVEDNNNNNSNFQGICRSFETEQNKSITILHQLEELIQRMENAGSMDADGGADHHAMLSRHVQRLRSVLEEKRKIILKLKTDFAKRKDKIELTRHSGSNAGGNGRRNVLHEETINPEIKLLVEEQDTIRHTQRRLNTILEEASETQDRLRWQREQYLQRAADQALLIAERIPVVQLVLRRIDSRRRREVVVLSTFVGVLLFLVFIFW